MAGRAMRGCASRQKQACSILQFALLTPIMILSLPHRLPLPNQDKKRRRSKDRSGSEAAVAPAAPKIMGAPVAAEEAVPVQQASAPRLLSQDLDGPRDAKRPRQEGPSRGEERRAEEVRRACDNVFVCSRVRVWGRKELLVQWWWLEWQQSVSSMVYAITCDPHCILQPELHIPQRLVGRLGPVNRVGQEGGPGLVGQALKAAGVAAERRDSGQGGGGRSGGRRGGREEGSGGTRQSERSSRSRR